MVQDAEGNEIDAGSEVAFYFSDAHVKRGRVAKVSQTVWEHRFNPGKDDIFIQLEEGGTKYKRRSDSMIVLPARKG